MFSDIFFRTLKKESEVHGYDTKAKADSLPLTVKYSHLEIIKMVYTQW